MKGNTVGKIIRTGKRLPAGLKRFDGEIYHIHADSLSTKSAATAVAQNYRQSRKGRKARISKLGGKWAVWIR